ncbi:PrtD family type I secretion system ABC transporter [Palleronia aestuarii]|uniref:PrtD family type I secretion system ABC transporter n=1 Tax=Palleronia aestuarii TaxID=568105 RepID=A0A2W7MZT9_9RHOB|nr:type I secretion system permease/ATPase [Palleronia aestuarii]PZX13103.1 PrtD family type I secretion system ABC transporter [Palleronia aestuarii]
MSQDQTIPTVGRTIRVCGHAFGAIFVISAIVNLLMLTGPVFMLQVYDRVLASGSTPTLLVLAGIAIGLYLTSGLLDILRLRALNRIAMRVYAKLSGPAFRANLRMPMVAGRRAASINPHRDVEAIRKFLGSPGPAAIFDLPFMPFYFLLIFLFHQWLGALAVGGGVVIGVLVVANEFLSRGPSRDLSASSGQQSRMMSTARRNAESITAMGLFDNLATRYSGAVEEQYRRQQAMSDHGTLFSSTIKMTRLMLQSAMLGLGAWLVILQEVSPGVMIASSIIMARALAPIEQAVSHWPSFIAARQATTRLNETLKACRDQPATAGLPAPRAGLKVEGLATAAPGDEALLLQDASFELRAGDGLGIIGPSGSGKSSLARALVGVWPQLAGSVRLDGATLDQWTEAERGAFIGYLPQDVELFDGTVAENICRFSAEPQIEQVLEAANLAGIHEMIVGLPEGYETQIGEFGTRLSAGQRQRLGLARALYGSPFLVVLDEPNSNLDTMGERALTQAMKAVRARGGIVIVIAHRASALSAVNRGLVIQNGHQVQFGDRDAVMGKVVPVPRPARNATHEPERASR